MRPSQELEDWIKSHRLPLKKSKLPVDCYRCDGKVYTLIEGFEDRIFNDQMCLNLSDEDIERCNLHEPDYVVYQFGADFYYSDYKEGKIKLKQLRHIGQQPREIEDEFPQLGIHGEYELMNGSRPYEDWCKKAAYLGATCLAVVEKNTLGGAIAFQTACTDAKIKPIIGETVTVRTESDEFDVKLYVATKEGWQSLLRIHKIANVDNDGWLSREDFLRNGKGLICVFTTTRGMNPVSIEVARTMFDKIYMQWDVVEFLSDHIDVAYLDMLKDYRDRLSKRLPPILIHDAYYLDKQDAHIKKLLNKMKLGAAHNQSLDQHLKSLDELFFELDPLFPDDSPFCEFFDEMRQNACDLANACEFQIPLGKLHLPKYEAIGAGFEAEMDDMAYCTAQDQHTDEYSVAVDDNEGLFFELIQRGFDAKVTAKGLDEDVYVDRIEKEVAVIKKGGFIDYFLILWDIVNFCKQNKILVGIGRGSAGGSLVANLLGITEVDPVHYNLLFERFLNESRITKGLPDIDMDFQAGRKGEVKAYMERKYGHEHVTRIGAYTTLKLKGAIKDLGREMGLEVGTLNYVTGACPKEDAWGDKWQDLFETALTSPPVRAFIEKYPQLVSDIQLLINQPKTQTQHAAGMIITPKRDSEGNEMTVFDWMPIRKVDGVLISEWEGTYIEMAGFLKEDILSLNQLDKFSYMLELIEQRTGERPNLNSIPLDDENVYNLFSQGFNEDVFQFGGAGLKGFCQDVKPYNIDMLISVVALYRPGPMEVGAHRDYILLNKGEREPKYDYMLESVTKPTQGLYIFQEQIMQAFQVLGGFSLVEADGVRKAMGKKIKEQMDGYKLQFLAGAAAKGCPEYEALSIWNTLEVFSGYGFNKSHAAAYTIMGYWSQWLKYHHPVAFWTASLQFSKDWKVPDRIAEMMRLKDSIQILPPDINYSQNAFTPHPTEARIFWSIGNISQLGPTSVAAIVKEREANGQFLSFEDFCRRMPKRAVNKRKVVNLILSGAFDQCEQVRQVQQRMQILWRYMLALRSKVSEDEFPQDKIEHEHFWTVKQKSLTGFGYLKYRDILKTTPWHKKGYTLTDGPALQDEKKEDKTVLVGGFLKEIMPRKSSRGPFAKILIDCNDTVIEMMLWNEAWSELQSTLEPLVGQPIFMIGKVVHDSKYSKKYVLHSCDETEVLSI